MTSLAILLQSLLTSLKLYDLCPSLHPPEEDQCTVKGQVLKKRKRETSYHSSWFIQIATTPKHTY
jgi:hypothetical protein